MAISFSYNSGVLEEHSLLGGVFFFWPPEAYIHRFDNLCRGYGRDRTDTCLPARRSALHSTAPRGTCVLAGGLPLPWRSQGCFPTSCLCPVTCNHGERKRCPIQLLLFGDEPDNFIVREVAECSPPPTANLSRPLNVVLTISKIIPYG